MTMNWYNLKKNKCPKCGKDFGFMAFSKPDVIVCPSKGCDFTISHKRYAEIVNGIVDKDLEKVEEETDE